MKVLVFDAARIGSLLFMVGASALGAGCDDGSTTGSVTDNLEEGAGDTPSYTSLETGIHWFGRGNESRRAVPGKANPFYDPSRPTVIYIHGWQYGSVPLLARETFNYAANDPKNGVDIDAADAWLDAGWNVGVFYWVQLADEAIVWDAEAKIWTTEGAKGMRWRKADGSYVTDDTPVKSAAELFVDAYLSAVQEQQNSTIRFVGHSLGNQMVVNGAKILADRVAAGEGSETVLPKRIALLDPFWSVGGSDYLGGQWTGERVRLYVEELIGQGVIFERYKTSNLADLNFGDKNKPLTDLIGETEIIPGWIHKTDQVGRHIAAPNLYFHSFAFAPPKSCMTERGVRNCDGLAGSASAPDSVIEENMNSSYSWIQTGGIDTQTPEDNVFEVQSR